MVSQSGGFHVKPHSGAELVLVLQAFAYFRRRRKLVTAP
jgi:hypothetical protein